MFCQHSRRHASTQHIFLAFFWLAMANSAINPLIYFQMNAKWDLMEEAFVVFIKVAFTRFRHYLKTIPTSLVRHFSRLYRSSKVVHLSETFSSKKKNKTFFVNKKFKFAGSRSSSYEINHHWSAPPPPPPRWSCHWTWCPWWRWTWWSRPHLPGGRPWSWRGWRWSCAASEVRAKEGREAKRRRQKQAARSVWWTVPTSASRARPGWSMVRARTTNNNNNARQQHPTTRLVREKQKAQSWPHPVPPGDDRCRTVSRPKQGGFINPQKPALWI